MYAVQDFASKKALRDAVKLAPVPCFQPGMLGRENGPVPDGIAYLEGPHYPAPHRFYARVVVADGAIVKILA